MNRSGLSGERPVRRASTVPASAATRYVARIDAPLEQDLRGPRPRWSAAILTFSARPTRRRVVRDVSARPPATGRTGLVVCQARCPAVPRWPVPAGVGARRASGAPAASAIRCSASRSAAAAGGMPSAFARSKIASVVSKIFVALALRGRSRSRAARRPPGSRRRRSPRSRGRRGSRGRPGPSRRRGGRAGCWPRRRRPWR